MTDPTKESTPEELDRIMRETMISASVARIVVREKAELQAEIDAAWFQIEHAWDIEPREYFENKYAAGKCGTARPLQMAIHYCWKRAVKEQAEDATRNENTEQPNLLVLHLERMTPEQREDFIVNFNAAKLTVECDCLDCADFTEYQQELVAIWATEGLAGAKGNERSLCERQAGTCLL